MRFSDILGAPVSNQGEGRIFWHILVEVLKFRSRLEGLDSRETELGSMFKSLRRADLEILGDFWVVWDFPTVGDGGRHGGPRW